MTHHCPVCLKKIPESAYKQSDEPYVCCFAMFGLDEKSGGACTAWGTIFLGNLPGEYKTIFPKEIFEKRFKKIKEKIDSGYLR